MAKGKKTGGGSRKGKQNKAIAPIRERFQQLLDGYSIEMMLKDLLSLDSAERLRIVTGLAEFVIPKLQRSEVNASVEHKEVQEFEFGGAKITF